MMSAVPGWSSAGPQRNSRRGVLIAGAVLSLLGVGALAAAWFVPWWTATFHPRELERQARRGRLDMDVAVSFARQTLEKGDWYLGNLLAPGALKGAFDECKPLALQFMDAQAEYQKDWEEFRERRQRAERRHEQEMDEWRRNDNRGAMPSRPDMDYPDFRKPTLPDAMRVSICGSDVTTGKNGLLLAILAAAAIFVNLAQRGPGGLWVIHLLLAGFQIAAAVMGLIWVFSCPTHSLSTLLEQNVGIGGFIGVAGMVLSMGGALLAAIHGLVRRQGAVATAGSF